jgi:tetratricopeptide (TPR) repeat protein
MKYLGGFIKANPNLIFPYILKSQLLSLEQKYLEASQLINGFLKEKEIKHALLYIELARINAALEKNDAEYNAYKEGLNHNPNNIDLLLLMASFYEDTSNYISAVKYYKKVLQLNPMNNVAKNNLATLLLDQFGKNEDIAESIRLTESFRQSKQPYFLDTYGWAQLKAGDVDKALSIFKQVIIQEPDIAIFRYHLAVALNALGDSMTAALELKQALHLMKEQSFPEKAIIKELLEQIEEN